MCRFEDFGTVFGHFSVQPGEFRATSSLIRKAVEPIFNGPEVRKLCEDRPDILSRMGYSILYTVGEFDLLLKLNLPDFHLVSRIQSALLQQGAMALSWVFATPFAHTGHQTPPATKKQKLILHLRINRNVYRANGSRAQSETLRALAQAISRSQIGPHTIYSSLGWFDLVVFADLGPSSNSILDLVLQLRRLTDDREQPIVQKTLTAFGFPCDRLDGSPEDSNLDAMPLCLVRSKPVGFDDAYNTLQQLISELGLEGTIGSLDGTTDLVAVPKGKKSDPKNSDGAQDTALSLSTALFRTFHDGKGHGIELAQTHLLFLEPEKSMTRVSDFESQGLLRVPVSSLIGKEHRQEEISVRKNISRLIDKIDSRVESTRQRPLSRGLRETLTNVLSLLQNAVGSTGHHADLLPAAKSLLNGLERLLDSVEKYYRLSRATSSDQNFYYNHLKRSWDRVRAWCEICQQLLNEHRAGSFDELFKEGNRITSHRGSVQSFLFILEHLANSFLTSVLQQNPSIVRVEPRLVVLFEPVPVVKSIPEIGVIRIPIRVKFSVPNALHPTWHEVGIYLFNQHIMQSAEDYTQRLIEIRYAHTGEILMPEDERISRIFREMGDLFADLITLIFGFQSDYDLFLKSLVSVHADYIFANRTPNADIQWRSVALRLFFASEFLTHWIRRERKPDSGIVYSDLGGNETQRVRSDIVAVVEQMDDVVSMERFRDLNNDSDTSFPPLPDLAREVSKEVTSPEISAVFTLLLYETAPLVPDSKLTFEREQKELISMDGLEDGEPSDLAGQDLSLYYTKVYRDELESRLGRPRHDYQRINFRLAAALGNSAILAFRSS